MTPAHLGSLIGTIICWIVMVIYWKNAWAPYYDPNHPIGMQYAYTDGDKKKPKKWPSDIPWPAIAPAIVLLTVASFLFVRVMNILSW
ncbi:MAG: hypothetical protein HW405_561 [Candidatus Berkelbacteria bacterium]|nr:hypothetical protein [Candidatus Berkelbacteria bacterium]